MGDAFHLGSLEVMQWASGRVMTDLKVRGSQAPEEQKVTMAPQPPEPSVLSASPIHARSENTITLHLSDTVSMIFVKVTAGKFFMGTDKMKDPGYEEKYAKYPEPSLEVTLDEYWISKTPLTYRQYWVFAPELYPSSVDEQNRLGDLPITLQFWKPGGQGMDMVNIEEFCKWFSEKTGGLIRLPSEAEWEKAARGTDGRIWPWGNNPPTPALCNFSESGIKKPTPVGKYSPQGDSPYGCVDMAGNVFELTQEGKLRGGYHSFARNQVRCAAEWSGVASATGFRLVMQMA
jgi:formylglycine-generating enzyme required for sulfatase activity